MSTIRTLHTDFAWVVVALNLVAGMWGVWLWRRKGGAPRAWWVAVGVAWGSIYLQGLLGVVMFNEFKPPFRHHFYGFLFAIITALVFPVRQEQRSTTRVGAFAFATLFMGIVAVRASLSL